VGREIQQLPRAEPVLAVTSLDNRLYLLRCQMPSQYVQQVEVYDIDSYRQLRNLTVSGLGCAFDIVACAHNRCAYISDSFVSSVHKIALSGDKITRWPVNGEPCGLSISLTHGILVTCCEARKIKEFTTDGQLLREVILPDDVVSPWHSVQLSSDEFIVCHGDLGDPLHRVCLVSSDGHVVKSFGGPKGESSQQMNLPVRLAVDENGFVFVADLNNRRVLLLSPSLTFVRDVVSSKQLTWQPLAVHLDVIGQRLYAADHALPGWPRRIHLDVTRQLLYVAYNETIDIEKTAGNVVVFSV